MAATTMPGVATATHSDGQGPKQDFAQGTGKVFLELLGGTQEAQIHVNAKSGPAGEDPQGHFFVRLDNEPVVVDFDFRGDVTCLTVTGNRATIGGVVERSKLPTAPAGSGVLIFVVDNGEGSNAPRDTFSFAHLGSPRTFCPLFPFGVPTDQGNFVVHDAAP